jgi:hypothetical protein
MVFRNRDAHGFGPLHGQDFHFAADGRKDGLSCLPGVPVFFQGPPCAMHHGYATFAVSDG